MPFYAVARGRTVGTFLTWDECKAQVEKFPDGRYKKFKDLASAEAFIEEHKVKVPSSFSTNSSTETKPFSMSYSTVIPTLGVPCRPKGTTFPNTSKVDETLLLGSSLRKVPARTPQAQLIPAMPMTTSSKPKQLGKPYINSKRKFKVTEDRVVGIKRAKLDSGGALEFNAGVDLSKFSVDEAGYVIVYTDGACKGNGRRVATAGIGVWFGDGHPLNISLPVEGNRRTNNTAEIQAAEKAILKAKEAGINKLNVKTDSQFLINCITKWIYSWKENKWKRSDGGEVKNQGDLEKLSAATEEVEIKWSYVPGHKGVYGNEKADELAVAGSRMSIPLQ